MIEKFKYGTTEIIVTVIGIALAIASQFLDAKIAALMPASLAIIAYLHMRMLIIAICAVFYGPMTGMLVGLGCELLLSMINNTPIFYPFILVSGLYGFFIGLYFGKTHYNPDDFSARTFVDFNAIQLLTSIFCSMMLLSLLSFLAGEASLDDGLTTGARVVAVNSVIIGIVCPLIMWIVYLVRRPGRRPGA